MSEDESQDHAPQNESVGIDPKNQVPYSSNENVLNSHKIIGEP